MNAFQRTNRTATAAITIERRGVNSGNLEIRAVPSLDDWQNERHTIEFGFALPESLKPHIGDDDLFDGVSAGSHGHWKATPLTEMDYPDLLPESEWGDYLTPALTCWHQPSGRTNTR